MATENDARMAPHDDCAHCEAGEIYEHFPEQTECVATCPVCGDYIDYCQGHGPIGDPDGYAILSAHDNDDHSRCANGTDCER